MKKRELLLLTDYFPFSDGETFLENEIPYLAENYNLKIISSDITSLQTRDVPRGVEVFRISPKQGYNIWEKIKYIGKFLFSKIGIQEIKEILEAGINRRSRLLSSLYFFVQSQDFLNQLKTSSVFDNLDGAIVYSYWSNYKLLAFVSQKRHFKAPIITRMHGYDLYNERYTTGRQPFKRQMGAGLDGILFVSNAGMEYYKRNFGYNSKMHLFRLGTTKCLQTITREKKHVFTLCSCSNVIPIKRIELIVDGLCQITETQIRWIHFGDGVSYEKIVALARKLPDNIECIFKGRVRNEEVLEYYARNQIDCFITTSETEGCPVSIMEVMSLGIPVIATSVGGIPEMLEHTSNILLSNYPNKDEVANAIKEIYLWSDEMKSKVKTENIQRWDSEFNADINNKKLLEYLNNL